MSYYIVRYRTLPVKGEIVVHHGKRYGVARVTKTVTKNSYILVLRLMPDVDKGYKGGSYIQLHCEVATVATE